MTNPHTDRTAAPSRNDTQAQKQLRLCVACRKPAELQELLRLTVDRLQSSQIFLNETTRGAGRVNGRSAYICKNSQCLEQAIKGTRLKQALQGRKLKGLPEKRRVDWPLESQLIHTMRSKCTENKESCQNTLRKEGC